jgi:hypothetical protein
MKKTILVLLLASLSTTAIADSYYNRNYHGHGNNGDVLLPLIVGGTLGYIIAQPRIVVQQPQYTPLPSYVPANNEPIYQYQNIYDGNCACYHRVLVQIN